MFTEAIKKLVANPTLFRDGERYKIPFFLGSHSTSYRRSLWKTFGFLLGIYLFRYQVTPTVDLSPFFMMALTCGPNMFRLSPELIALFDTPSARFLLPWLRLQHNAAFKLTDDVGRLLLALEINVRHSVSLYFSSLRPPFLQPSDVNATRSSMEEHQTWTSTLLARHLLSFDGGELWRHSEFSALREGFNIKLRNDKSFISVSNIATSHKFSTDHTNDSILSS